MFPLARFRIEDHSMSPALNPGDYVIINRRAYRHHEPMEGDVVVLRHPEDPDKFLVKRVTSRTGPDSYFVVGDNESDSEDSRRFGPVRRESIVGKVWFHAKA